MDLTSGVQSQVLPNGLTILVERNDSAPVVAAVTHVKTGYYNEPDKWVGISHVLEHMYFKGTARRPDGVLARETQRLGGYLNAGTIYDKTIYYTVLPATEGALQRAVDLQADALMHTALESDSLSRELEVIIQEANRKLDSPADVAAETLYELLFGQHRMRRWRIGTDAGLRELTVDDVRSYYRTRYTPQRTIVALVGDLDVDMAIELGVSTYGSWHTDPPVIDTSPPEVDSPAPSVRVVRGDVERPVAVVGWRTVDVLHDDSPALDVAAAVLGSGRGSWLSRAVRTPGLASSASALHYANSEVGVFPLMFDGDERRIDAAVGRGMELVGQLRSAGPDASDLERVRSLISLRWSRRLESMDGRATLWADCMALGDLALAERFYQAVIDVTADQVRDVAARHLRDDLPCAVMYGPTGFHTRFEQSALADRARPSNGLPAVRPPVIATVRKSGSRSADSAVIGDVVHQPLPGADLLVRPKRGSGLVFVGAWALGLRGLETIETAGVSALVARAAVRGAGGMGPEELALAAETLGGSVGPSVSLDAVGWGITVRSTALGQAAELLRKVALEANLDPEQLSVERSLQASDAARLRDDMYAYPIRRVLGRAFPDCAYGLPTLGNPETVATLSDDLVHKWAEQLKSRRLTVIAVGDGEADDLIEALRTFESLPGARDARADPSPVRWGSGCGAETRDKAQSAIAMAFRASPYDSPNRLPLIVAGSVLSGLAGRLFEELRVKRSLAYTVSAMPWFKRDVGAVLSYIATSPEREQEARDAMLHELAAVGQSPVSESEVERARNYAAGALQLRLQSAHAVAGEILEAWIHGDLSSLPSLASELRSVTNEDVMRVAAEVFDADERAEFVVRGTREATGVE